MSSTTTTMEQHSNSEWQKIMKKCSPISLNMISSPTPIKEHSESEWQNTLEEVLPGVLRLHITTSMAFDFVEAQNSIATAFVVDKYRGIALTNRHCVRFGPASFRLRFNNGEEILAERIYVDPIHDFAFLKFDPSAIKYMKVTEIELDPNGATVGLDVRIIGNDSGEFFTALKGVIVETHRYDNGRYIDWNTAYIVTCVLTRGGSSGSPMIDIRGKALAIHAYGNMAGNMAGDMRLERVIRALDYLKKGALNGCAQDQFRGIGVVVHHSISLDKGLILVKNIAAPVTVGTVTMNFCYKELHVEGVVVFEDSAKGFSLISYSPSDLCGESINIIPVNFYPHASMKNEIINIVTLNDNNCYESRRSVITSVHKKKTTRVIRWCGGIVQETPQRIIARGFSPGGVFVTRSNKAAPLASIVKPPYSWITHINRKKIKDMGDFDRCVRLLMNEEIVSIKVVNESGHTLTRPLQMDLLHFPILEFTLDEEMGFMSKAIA